MAFATVEELGGCLADDRARTALLRLYPVAEIIREAVIDEAWQPPEALTGAIKLTQAGEEALTVLPEGLDGESSVLSVFAAFFWHELFVDLARTNADTVVREVSAAYRTGALRLPWLFGRLLYDRYAQTYNDYEPRLDEAATLQLLAGTPAGIVHYGHIVAGPFGLLETPVLRNLEPNLSGPLVKCQNPGCPALHRVKLSTSAHEVNVGAMWIGRAQREDRGRPSEWHLFVDELTGARERYLSDTNPTQLALIVGNALTLEETRAVLAHCIGDASSALRETAQKNPEIQDRFKASSRAIVASLSQGEAIQLLLLASDEALVRAVESALDAGEIGVPATEVRTPVLNTAGYSRGWLNVGPELGSAGLRFMPKNDKVGPLRLARLLEDVFGRTGERGHEELAWQLRHEPGESVRDKLLNLSRRDDPKAVLKRFVLSSRERLTAAEASLKYGHWPEPTSPREEEGLLDRMLWKLGFRQEVHAQRLPTLWALIEDLEGVVGQLTEPYGPRDKQEIRSVGVNLFVSLEEVLDYSLAFACWALLSNHYGMGPVARFRFDIENARAAMVQHLAGRPLGSGDELRLADDGTNTLFPLIHGFGALSRLSKEILASSRDAYRLPVEAVPSYGALYPFPFKHSMALLDLKPQAQERICDDLPRITQRLGRGDVANLRNRIDHMREDFPSAEELRAGCTELRAAIEALENLGLGAEPFVYRSGTTDSYGRGVARLEDYRGVAVELYGPSELEQTGLPAINESQLIFGAAGIAGSSEVLRFTFSEVSPFSRMWQGYPASTDPRARHRTKMHASSEDESGV